jgi:hypothetical protein
LATLVGIIIDLSQRNNRLVWDETVRIVMDLFQDVWQDQDTVVIDHCLDITLSVRFLSLLLILDALSPKDCFVRHRRSWFVSF